MPNISRTKTWNANETLTAADLNAEFNGILTGVNDNTLNNDNLNQTDDYLFGSLVTGSGLAAGGGDGKLHVHVADAGSVTAHASGNDFVIEGTANPGMSFLSGASTTNSIYFGDVNDNDAGSIVYTHGTDMAFTVETVEVLALSASTITASADILAASSSANEPVLTLQNTHNGATSAYLKFVNDKGAAGADNDVCGTITFYGDDDNQDNIEFARIEGVVADASNGDECGAIKLYVAENDGNNTVGLALTGSTTDGEVDVTVGAGSASVVTIPGHIDLAGDIDVDGTTNLDAVDIDGTVTVGANTDGYDVKFFGNAAGAYMEWDESEDQLRIMGASADATTSTGKLLLATSLTDINANDVLGKIDFQAPHEAGGTDAITIAASIQAIAQGTFAADLNATDLIFYTGHSEAATEKFRMTSQGEIGIGGANYGTDGQVLTSAGAGAAVAWESPATVTNCKFSAYHSAGTANVTGDATTYTVVYGTEVFDIGSNFASNTFTAPVEGYYLFNLRISATGVASNHLSNQTRIVTTDASFSTIDRTYDLVESNGVFRQNYTVIAYLDAGDTAYVTFQVSGGSKTVDLQNTYLSNSFDGAIL